MSNNVERGFLSKVRTFCERQKLLLPDGKYVVALSGGADSVALLLALKRLDVNVEAATCNFRLRGEESDRDEQFCVSLCQRECIPLHRVHFDTREYASLHKVSIEMAARELRYEYFERLRRDIGADGICVAHHRDDCVETVLLNLIRGTGIHGLRGIMPKNGFILRPLLCVSRCEIEQFLASFHQDFVTDSSNLVADVQRNKVRLKVLPLLEAINPAARQNIYETAQNLVEAAQVCDAVVQLGEARIFNEAEGSIDVGQLQLSPSPEYALFHILHRHGFNASQCRQIHESLEKGSGRLWRSATHELVIDREKIFIQPITTVRERPLKVPEVGNYVYDEQRKFSFVVEAVGDDYQVSRSQDTVCVDAEKVRFPLFVRRIAQGDRFVPFGMKGSKLVSDYLTDRKRTLFQKHGQLVLTDLHDNIVWLVGERPDNRFCITSKTTSALRISLHD